MGPLILLLAVIAAGVVSAFYAGRLPMSGKVALGLSLLPIAGIGLMRLFC
jgi:hypothetical protein